MNKSKFLTPKKAAKELGISTVTLYRWEKANKINVIYTPNGRRRIPLSEIDRLVGNMQKDSFCCIYVRVRSKKQALDGTLQKQKEKLISEAQNRSYKIVAIIEEIGSNFKENRTNLVRFLELANQKEFNVLLIENKNIIFPFGFSYIEKQLSLLGINIDVIEKNIPINLTIEILKDLLLLMISILPTINTLANKDLIKTKWKLYNIRKILSANTKK